MNEKSEIFRFIAYGYLVRNYGQKFVKNTEYHIVKGSIKKDRCTAVFWRNGGDGFNIYIDLKKKTIIHDGCYAKNKRFSSEEIINNALNKYKNEIS